MENLMKRKTLKIVLFTVISFVLQGCFPSQEVKVISEDADPVSSSGGGGSSNGGGGSSGPVTGQTCTGTTADGTGSGFPIHIFNLELAGHQVWLPSNNNPDLTPEGAIGIFQSDSRVKVRLKVHPQPNPPKGVEYCRGRVTGKAEDVNYYTKLRFRVHLRDIKCNTPDPNDSSKCSSGFYLGNRYRTQTLEPISVDRCSPIIDVAAQRGLSNYGTAIEIEDVKSDTTCQFNSTHCPAEDPVRTASCWRMSLQVSTDYTQDIN